MSDFVDPSAIAEVLKKKWKPIIEHSDVAPITDTYRRNVTAILLENQEQAMLQETTNVAAAMPDTGGVAKFDPVMISLVRRAMPNLMAYDICGVQPMTGPTGLIFAMKSKFSTMGGTEAFQSNVDTEFSGATAALSLDSTDPLGAGTTQGLGAANAADPGRGFSTTAVEKEEAFNQMAFEIARTSVTAKSRALKAEYTTELAQDLKAVHGLDAETELANILSNEILFEINREVIRTIYVGAKLGAQQSDLTFCGASDSDTLGASAANFGVATANGIGGIYDIELDSDGRWSAERFRGLLFQIEREANEIAKDTRRGKGNILICSSDVASAIAMGGWMNLSGGDAGNLVVDDMGNTFAGTIGGGRIKVYVDPYATINYCIVGYRGPNAYDAGLFYCPYVPLQMVRAVGENTFQPKIAFKTRYGLVNNPFVGSSYSDPSSSASNRRNQYYRIFRVDSLHGGLTA
jgi:hypothetical protein